MTGSLGGDGVAGRGAGVASTGLGGRGGLNNYFIYIINRRV